MSLRGALVASKLNFAETKADLFCSRFDRAVKIS